MVKVAPKQKRKSAVKKKVKPIKMTSGNPLTKDILKTAHEVGFKNRQCVGLVELNRYWKYI